MSAAQAILAIDDSSDVHPLVAARLKSEGYVLHHANDGLEGIRMARDLRPDLILLDVDMPELSGFEVCRALQADPVTSSIPIIFLTGSTESFLKVEAFDLGAVDYVTKPFDAPELRARVRAALRTKRYHDMLALRAEVDGLTGLFNRAHFDRRLAEMISSWKVSGKGFAVIVIDIDHFKSINDSYGHPFGDRVIQLLGEVLASTVRGTDFACRYGGEEFAILASGAGVEGALAAAKRFATRLGAASCDHKGTTVKVTASVGVASTDLFAAGVEITPAQIVAAADNALYEAKRQGRDRICQAAARNAGD